MRLTVRSLSGFLREGHEESLEHSEAGLPKPQCKSEAEHTDSRLLLSLISELDQMISVPEKFSSRPLSEKAISWACPQTHPASVYISNPTANVKGTNWSDFEWKDRGRQGWLGRANPGHSEMIRDLHCYCLY